MSESNNGSDKSKYLVFDLNGENYGIPLYSVKEVIGITEITTIPNVPSFFKGLVNLRGKIISIIDLRSKLKLPEIKFEDKKTTIIIVEISGVMIGTIVDDVKAVANFEKTQIENNIDLQGQVGRDFITGVAKTDEKGLTLLLDIGKVLSIDEMALIRKQNLHKAA